MRIRVLVVLAGCWSDAKPPPQAPIPPPQDPPAVTVRKRVKPPSPCETAIDHAIEAFRAEIDRNPTMLQRLDAVRAAAITSCATTEWTQTTMTCFETAADTSAVQGCLAGLSSDQLRDLRDRMTEAMKAP